MFLRCLLMRRWWSIPVVVLSRMALRTHEMQPARHERHDAPLRTLRPGEVFAVVAFWAFLALLTAAGRLLDPRTPLDATFSRGLVTLAFIEYSICAALTLPIFHIVARLGETARGWTARMVTYLGIG